MARKVFYSFHYAVDAWRASQVRNMGVIEGNAPVSDNDWETVKKGGDAAIEKWIADQLTGKSCAVVLVGAETASRKWVIHEIQEAWNAKKGVVGVRIHNLKNASGNLGTYGANPFDKLTLQNGTHCCPRQDRPVAGVAENTRLGGAPVDYLGGGLRFEVSRPVQVIPAPG